MSFTQLLGWAGSILGLASLVAASIAILRAGVAKTTAELWKGQAEAALSTLAHMKVDHEACKSRLDELERQHGALEELVTEALQANDLLIRVRPDPPKRAKPRQRKAR